MDRLLSSHVAEHLPALNASHGSCFQNGRVKTHIVDESCLVARFDQEVVGDTRMSVVMADGCTTQTVNSPSGSRHYSQIDKHINGEKYPTLAARQGLT